MVGDIDPIEAVFDAEFRVLGGENALGQQWNFQHRLHLLGVFPVVPETPFGNPIRARTGGGIAAAARRHHRPSRTSRNQMLLVEVPLVERRLWYNWKYAEQ